MTWPPHRKAFVPLELHIKITETNPFKKDQKTFNLLRWQNRQSTLWYNDDFIKKRITLKLKHFATNLHRTATVPGRCWYLSKFCHISFVQLLSHYLVCLQHTQKVSLCLVAAGWLICATFNKTLRSYRQMRICILYEKKKLVLTLTSSDQLSRWEIFQLLRVLQKMNERRKKQIIIMNCLNCSEFKLIE